MGLTHRHIAVGFLAAILGGIGLGYYFGYYQPMGGAGAPMEDASMGAKTGIANPASTNCVAALGGTLEIRDEVGGQVGYCHIKDGRVCEEWALFRDNTCKSPR